MTDSIRTKGGEFGQALSQFEQAGLIFRSEILFDGFRVKGHLFLKIKISKLRSLGEEFDLLLASIQSGFDVLDWKLTSIDTGFGQGVNSLLVKGFGAHLVNVLGIEPAQFRQIETGIVPKDLWQVENFDHFRARDLFPVSLG